MMDIPSKQIRTQRDDLGYSRLLRTLFGDRRWSSPAYTVWDTGDDRLLRTLFGIQEMIVSFIHCLGDRRCFFNLNQLYKHDPVLNVFQNLWEFNGYQISISFIHCFGRQKMSVSLVHCLGYRKWSSPAYTVWERGDDRLLRTLFGLQEMIVSFVHCLGYRRWSSPAYTVWETGDASLWRTLFWEIGDVNL